MSICGYFKNNKQLVRDYNLANTYREKKKRKKEKEKERTLSMLSIWEEMRERTRGLFAML